MTCHHAPIDHHQPIPEDESHCPCGQIGEQGIDSEFHSCPCPCHGPSWLQEDSDVPDFSPSELEEMANGE